MMNHKQAEQQQRNNREHPPYPQRARFTNRVPERRSIPRDKPQTFLLKWNHEYIGKTEQERRTWQECWGTLYPNGRVSLDYGSAYDSMSDLREHVSQIGTYLFHWLAIDNLKLGVGEGTADPVKPV